MGTVPMIQCPMSYRRGHRWRTNDLRTLQIFNMPILDLDLDPELLNVLIKCKSFSNNKLSLKKKLQHCIYILILW